MDTYLGIMVGTGIYKRITKGRTSFENLSFYEAACEHYNLTVCYFRFEDINPGEDTVMAYVKNAEGKYILRKVQKPAIIHNRTFTGKRAQRRKMRKLKKEGITFFNENNRYKKLNIYKILRKNKTLHPHLPETVQASRGNLKRMMDKYPELIIKPNSGTLGIGVVKLTKKDNQEWELTSREHNSLKKQCFSTDWPPLLQKLADKSYLIIQERIPLAKSKGGIFDMRVTVQRNDTGNWQVSGMAGKVAQKGWYLTNVARGGTCHSLEELLDDLPHLNQKQVSEDIKKLSIMIAGQLAQEIPNIADVGLDIGITHDGVPMFIECNCRDLRIVYKHAGMKEEWKQTHFAPVGYAKFLSES
ncbi:YheC/D like ATP-grasp [[Bacillus] enclensis]|uniref:YheC/D like ATP-grasp n=1 Tax=[Bacillus] enclensis TaxID=1402860 RepID=A0A1C3YU57_9BACI|nr:YheC/YheD family protein [[Bacillus] enclensis]SCB73558.1 YheC/D like ATP-grasp [[Bacillus] enclensis]